MYTKETCFKSGYVISLQLDSSTGLTSLISAHRSRCPCSWRSYNTRELPVAIQKLAEPLLRTVVERSVDGRCTCAHEQQLKEVVKVVWCFFASSGLTV